MPCLRVHLVALLFMAVLLGGCSTLETIPRTTGTAALNALQAIIDGLRTTIGYEAPALMPVPYR